MNEEGYMPCNGDPDSVCPEIVRNEDFWEVCKEMQLKKAFQQFL